MVLPTGTGKTQIALEDLASFKGYMPELKALVLVPTIDLKDQWIKNINEKVEIKNNVEVMTYAGICHNYKNDLAIKYNYIIVDACVIIGLKLGDL